MDLDPCMGRTRHFRPSHLTQQLNSSQEFSCSKQAAEKRTHERDKGGEKNRQTIVPCWNLCFSPYAYMRNLKTAKGMEGRRSLETGDLRWSQFMKLQGILLTLNLPPWDSNLFFSVVSWVLVLPSTAPSLSLQKHTWPELANRGSHMTLKVQQLSPAWSLYQPKGGFLQSPKLLPRSQSTNKTYHQPGPPLLWDAGEITYSLQLLQPCPWRVQPFLDTAAAQH